MAGLQKQTLTAIQHAGADRANHYVSRARGACARAERTGLVFAGVRVNDTCVNLGFAYLLILALAGAMWLQWRRIQALAQEVHALERRLRALAAEREPLTLTDPLPDEEPLLLDTPLPDAANDESEPQPAQAINPITWGVRAALVALFAWHFIAFAADDMAFAIGLLGAAALGPGRAGSSRPGAAQRPGAGVAG